MIGFAIALASALSIDAVKAVVEVIPKQLITGLSVAGGLLPAIGFAMILSVMIKKEVTSYVLLGYVCVAYLQLPVMGVALVGLVFALIDYFKEDKVAPATTQEETEYGI